MKKTKKIKVFIVDDNDDLINSIAKCFKASNSFEYLDKANAPDECLQKLEYQVNNIDIILMDVEFPEFEMDGIQLARKIREVHPGNTPKIAFLTIGDRAIVESQNGFHGHIPKNKGISELMDMLREIHYNEAVYFPPLELRQSFIEKLTRRQKVIFCLFLQSTDHKVIARQLNITTNTLVSHRKVILSKIQQSGIDVDRIDHPKMIELAQKYRLCDHL